MKKLLYITDQQEYTEHGTIGPLFNGYLKQYMDVTIVYFTRFKHSFQCKGNHMIVPETDRDELVDFLAEKGMGLDQYDIVMVRNMEDILRQVLATRTLLGYKVAFRVSIPKTVESYERLKARSKTAFFASIGLKWKLARKRDLINCCDLFLPSSRSMSAAFYHNVTAPLHTLPAGIDPQFITRNAPSDNGVRRFIYVGSLDELRQFETVMDAFDALDPATWHLSVSTFNPDFFESMLRHYRHLQNNITILRAENLQTLREQIRQADVGLALLPSIPLYATSLPAKVLDYYACGIPALLSDNPKNRMIFPGEGEAYFSSFDTETIQECLRELIETPVAAIEATAGAGLERLLQQQRGYDSMAQALAQALEEL